jgi:hypothetical protein
MNEQSGNNKAFIQKFLRNLFGAKKPTVPAPAVTPADNLIEPAIIVTSRVLLVIYDPVVEPITVKKLSEYMHWKRPDDLANAYIQDIMETSGGMARYQIVERVELNEFPAKIDGYRYDADTYLSVVQGGVPPYKPSEVDYQAILTGLNVLPRIPRREIDEVWVMAFPHAGFYESTMCGAGAFWCNSQPQTWSANCSRRFVVMGFSFERGVGEMLENFGHRTESILNMTFSKTSEAANLFRRYTLYDKEAPDQAGVGTIHYAPNSDRDYDWNNPRLVKSACYDWFNFPNFQNDIREVNADEWGNGNLHAHHIWWLNHLPRVAGRTSGIANNWWQYMMDPNLVNL